MCIGAAAMAEDEVVAAMAISRGRLGGAGATRDARSAAITSDDGRNEQLTSDGGGSRWRRAVVELPCASAVGRAGKLAAMVVASGEQ